MDAVVVINAGSSSLKFSVFDLAARELVPQLRGQVEGLGNAPRFVAQDASGATVAQHSWPAGARVDHAAAVDRLLDFLDERLGGRRIAAVGHRVVHGGVDGAQPVRVDAAVLDRLAALVPLAPLHQSHNLAPIRALMTRAPALAQVACFDTAFHRTQPALAQAFALPASITARGVRRYGFHGLSYEYIAGTLPAIDAAAARGRVVVAHLGNGASMCALRGGVSEATTMGLTALDGLMMGTRTGALDPGVVLYLMNTLGMDARAIEHLLYRESGLLGVSGISSDMRTLLASDDPRARFAIALFCYRIARELGSLAAALGGLDALVFTGGIGERAAPVRAQVLAQAAWLGLALDESANGAHATRITAGTSRIPAYVIPTDEERMIALHTRALVGATGVA
ncbi:MAG: acetate/propionate family kinase [Betaproteobacteria bacterium]